MVAAADKAGADALRKKGWSVLDKGWPDLLVYDPKKRTVMAIELKRGNDKLRPDQVEMAKVFTDLLGTPFYVARDKDIEGLMRKKGRVVLPEGSFNDLDGRLDRLKSEHRKLGWEIEAWEKEMAGTSHVFQTIQEDQEPKLPEEDTGVDPKTRQLIESWGFYKPTDEQEVAATASHA